MNPNPNNVTNIADKKPSSPATHTITYVLDGFSITTTLETTAPIVDVIARLKALGATPEPTKSQSAPLCPAHPGRKMKASTARPGTFFCTAKDPETGEYCKSKS